MINNENRNHCFNLTESGVMFYSNNFANPSAARKKIHGGSGVIDNGDGYGPGCAFGLISSSCLS